MNEKMNSKVKKLWLKALRSGKYKQTKGVLKNHKGYCCLGVLADIYNKDKINSGWKYDDYLKQYRYEEKVGVLSDNICKWANISTQGGFHNIKGEYKALVTFNDRGKSFKQIANYIERYF